MLFTMLQAKLHRVTVTQADLHYEGSCGIDITLLRTAGIHPNQYIEIYNVTTGDRFSTYALEAKAASGTICLNGASARKAAIGDLLIICAYSQYTESEVETHKPIIVLVDSQNRVTSVR